MYAVSVRKHPGTVAVSLDEVPQRPPDEARYVRYDVRLPDGAPLTVELPLRRVQKPVACLCLPATHGFRQRQVYVSLSDYFRYRMAIVTYANHPWNTDAEDCVRAFVALFEPAALVT